MSRHMCPLPTAPPCCTLQVPEVLLWDTLQGVGAVQNLRKYSHPPSAKWAPFPAAWLGHPSTEAPPLPAQHSWGPKTRPSGWRSCSSPRLLRAPGWEAGWGEAAKTCEPRTQTRPGATALEGQGGPGQRPTWARESVTSGCGPCHCHHHPGTQDPAPRPVGSVPHPTGPDLHPTLATRHCQGRRGGDTSHSMDAEPWASREHGKAHGGLAVQTLRKFTERTRTDVRGRRPQTRECFQPVGQSPTPSKPRKRRTELRAGPCPDRALPAAFQRRVPAPATPFSAAVCPAAPRPRAPGTPLRAPSAWHASSHQAARGRKPHSPFWRPRPRSHPPQGPPLPLAKGTPSLRVPTGANQHGPLPAWNRARPHLAASLPEARLPHAPRPRSQTLTAQDPRSQASAADSARGACRCFGGGVHSCGAAALSPAALLPPRPGPVLEERPGRAAAGNASPQSIWALREPGKKHSQGGLQGPPGTSRRPGPEVQGGAGQGEDRGQVATGSEVWVREQRTHGKDDSDKTALGPHANRCRARQSFSAKLMGIPRPLPTARSLPEPAALSRASLSLRVEPSRPRVFSQLLTQVLRTQGTSVALSSPERPWSPRPAHGAEG